MKKKRGFTLIELITVIAILSVLGTLLMPQVNGYVGTSKDVVCISNQNTLNRIYRTAKASDENLTAQDVLTNKNGKFYGGKGECPGEGTYSVVSDIIVCDKHHGTGGSGGGTVVSPNETELYKQMLAQNAEFNRCSALPKGDKDSDAARQTCFNNLYGNLVTNGNGGSFSNDLLLRTLFEERGHTWDKVDPAVLNAAGMDTNKDYYLRAYFTTASQDPLIFVNQSNVATGNWSGVQLVYYGGSWYKYTAGKDFVMTVFHGLSVDEVRMKIATNFTKMEI
ncbi:MAG: type II secretion system protein [Anaerorhabdus sp.]